MKPKCACGGIGWNEKKQRMDKRLEFIVRLEKRASGRRNMNDRRAVYWRRQSMKSLT